MIVEHIDTGSLMFCPGSQISDKPLKSIDHLMGVEQKFAIIKLDKIRGNACVSRRQIVSSNKKEDKVKIIGKFNIQGHFNGAYILLGLLYGKGDYLESIKICTRCGQDTDSNVANCGGIMGVMVGYKGLPNDVKNELAPYMDRDYYYTSLSINSASELSYDLAIKNILNNGGKILNAHISIKTQQ